MKKSFTLIELLVTITLSMIFLNFVFGFKLNFFEQTNNLQDDSKVVYKNFNLSQIITKGFKEGNLSFPGLITANNRRNKHEFISYDQNSTVKYDKQKVDGIDRLKFYIHSDFFLDRDLSMKKRIEIDEASSSGNDLYVVTFKLNEDNSSNEYSRFVYPR